MFATGAGAELVLPGTQPRDNNIHLREVNNCRRCHTGTPNGQADPVFSWEGGMMAQAARDPVFRAALAVANQDIKGVGEFCIRCHSPRAWLEGRSSAPDASLLTGDDLNGVSCDFCHHLVDPLSKEARGMVKSVPPGYGNGMFVVDGDQKLRGPYSESKGLTMHTMADSPYHASSELCGNCHNVSNPTLANDVTRQPPSAFGHIERTYSEWSLSDFATNETTQSCQSCHFPRVPGGGKAVNYTSQRGDMHRDYFVSHDGVGASTWVQDAIYLIWEGQDLNREALDAGKARARKLLKTAATLGLDLKGNTAHIAVTNLTGHKLPTGYPEGRRLWLNVRFLNEQSRVIQELGRYGETNALLNGHQVGVTTLLEPAGTRVYECKPGISAAQAAKYGKTAGASFHFVLNDVITKDNRIPPRGFRNAKFQEHLAAPVGSAPAPGHDGLAAGFGAAEYADGQYWDVVEMPVPAGTRRIEVRLMYQSVSWEYLKFLVEENHTDQWGSKLFAAWQETGRCAPEEIALVVKNVTP